MVEGVEIVSYRMLPEHAKTAMSIVAAADYNVFYKDKGNCPFTLDELKGRVKAFYEDAPEILVTKKTKKSEKVMESSWYMIFRLRKQMAVRSFILKYLQEA